MVTPNPRTPSCGGVDGGETCGDCLVWDMPPGFAVSGSLTNGFCESCEEIEGFGLTQGDGVTTPPGHGGPYSTCQYWGNLTPSTGSQCSVSDLLPVLTFTETKIHLRLSNIADTVEYEKLRSTGEPCNSTHTLTKIAQPDPSEWDCGYPGEVEITPSP